MTTNSVGQVYLNNVDLTDSVDSTVKGSSVTLSDRVHLNRQLTGKISPMKEEEGGWVGGYRNNSVLPIFYSTFMNCKCFTQNCIHT